MKQGERERERERKHCVRGLVECSLSIPEEKYVRERECVREK